MFDGRGEADLEASVLAWRARWRTRGMVVGVTTVPFLQVLDVRLVFAWLAGAYLMQAFAVFVLSPTRVSKWRAAGSLSSLACSIILASGLVLQILAVMSVSSEAPVGWLLAYALTIGGFMNSVTMSGGVPRLFGAAVAPGAIGVTFVFPLLMADHGLTGREAATIGVMGVMSVMVSVLAFKRFAKLMTSEIEARRLAEAATEARGRFMATISHELRTPISAIQAGARALAERAAAAADRSQAELILESSRMMRTLLDDLLDLAKLEAGRLTTTAAPYRARTTIASTAAFWRAEARRRGLRLQLSGARAIPTGLVGDEVRLKQILNNLLSNAMKFTTEGGVTLELAYEGERLTMAVRDTGCGMAPEQMRRLFQPFSQADDSVAATYGGTGLGLAISQDLARAMGGGIEVESIPGVGTCFVLSLPATRAEVEGVAPTDVAALEGLIGLRVLGVDDHEVNRKVLGLILEPLGVHLTLAEDGAAAIARLAEQPFDLMLVDVHMPGLSGYDVVRQVRASDGPNASVPVIAVTGALTEADGAERATAGIQAVVAKPLEPEMLYGVMASLVARHGPQVSRAA